MLTRSHSARLFTALLSLPLFFACGESDEEIAAQKSNARRAAASAWLAACARPLSESATPSELQLAIEDLKPKAAPPNQAGEEVLTRSLEERTRRAEAALEKLALLRSARRSLSDSLRWPTPDSGNAELDATAVRSWAREVEVGAGAERRRPADLARELRAAHAALAAEAVQVEELRALEQQLTCVAPGSELDRSLSDLGAALCSSAERTGVKLDVQARRCDASRLGLRDGWTLIAGAAGQGKVEAAPREASAQTNGAGVRAVEAGAALDFADALASLANTNAPTFVAWGADRAPQGFGVLELRKSSADSFSQAHVRVAASTTDGELVVHGFARDWKDARPRYLLVPGHAAWLAVTVKVNTDAGTEEIKRAELGEQSLVFADTDAALQRALERCDVTSAKRFAEQLDALAPNAAAQARGVRELQSALRFESESRVLLERLAPCATGVDELLGGAERLLAGRATGLCTAELEARVREVKAVQNTTRELERVRDQVQSLKGKPAPRVSALWAVAQALEAARTAGAKCEQHARIIEDVEGALIAEVGRIQLASPSLAECAEELEALERWREVSARPELATHAQSFETALAQRVRDEFEKATPGELPNLLSMRIDEATQAGPALQRVVAECAIDVLARTAPGEAAPDLERLKWLAQLDAVTAKKPELLEGALMTQLGAQCSTLSKVAGEKKTPALKLTLWANWSKQERLGSGGPVREMVWTEVVKPLWEEIDNRLQVGSASDLDTLVKQQKALKDFVKSFQAASMVQLTGDDDAGAWAREHVRRLDLEKAERCERIFVQLSEAVDTRNDRLARSLSLSITKALDEDDPASLHAQVLLAECLLHAATSKSGWEDALRTLKDPCNRIKSAKLLSEVDRKRLHAEASWVRALAQTRLTARTLEKFDKELRENSVEAKRTINDCENQYDDSRLFVGSLPQQERFEGYGSSPRTYRRSDVMDPFNENEAKWLRLFEDFKGRKSK
ncbi:MAG: hypothetical protein JNN27_17685 [Planctomycetes bacterium]|nr:hypothetical protein [Planctomycetota bacterium]